MKRLTAFFVLFLTALCFALTASAAGDAIHSVTIDGNAVKVSVTAQSDCALWGAVYDESGKMTAARSESVSGAADPQTVTISFDNISENAYAKAFLLDSEKFSPLTACGDTRTPDSDVYAILYADGALVFQHGDTPRSGYVIATYPVDMAGSYQYDYGSQTPNTPWYEYSAGTIQRVEFADKIQPTSTAYWFYGCSALKEISNIEKLDTSHVTNMENMFTFCNSLPELDVSNFNADNVTDMSYMFCGCHELTTLNVSRFNTANVVDMSGMFSYCQGLTELDVSGFNTAKVEYMYEMFTNCSALKTLNLGGFDTAKVTYMDAMFSDCSELTELDLSSFDTAKVEYMNYMFRGCYKLTAIYVSDKFITNQVVDASDMFTSCFALIGGNGTQYAGSYLSYARIDGGPDNPGYFTAK
ncbi:MAG: BspA family leucine-rich repeat surface protein [Oscillospiraceae bacterium]|nr:BspA family leucine-rich repeat surface protein [Oscillospiraceae bacterium]